MIINFMRFYRVGVVVLWNSFLDFVGFGLYFKRWLRFKVEEDKRGLI